MDREHIFQWVLIVLLLVLLYLSFLIVRPFLTYVVLGLILGYLFHPVYRWFAKHMPHAVAALIVILLVLLIVLLPTAFIIIKLVGESIAAYNSLSGVIVERSITVVDKVLAFAGITLDDLFHSLGRAVRDYVVTMTPSLLSSIASTLLGIFIMFFLMYFAFTDGERWFASVKEAIPMATKHKNKLFDQIGSVTYAVMYGQFLTAVVQGVIGGLMFFAFGIPNPIFWGFIMMILSFIPMLGTPLVWIPAAIIELMNKHYLAGIGVLVIGAVIVMNIDNFLKPKLIGNKAQLSTPLVLLGVLGGLQLFGLVGLILGPLILALLQTVMTFFHKQSGKDGSGVKKRPTH